MLAAIMMMQAGEPACARPDTMTGGHRGSFCVQTVYHRSHPRYTMRGPGELCTDEHRLAVRRDETVTVELSETGSVEARLSGGVGGIRFSPSYWMAEQEAFLEAVPGVKGAYRLKAQAGESGLPYRLTEGRFHALWIDGTAFRGGARDKVMLRRFAARGAAPCDWSLDRGGVGYGNEAARRRSVVTSQKVE